MLSPFSIRMLVLLALVLGAQARQRLLNDPLFLDDFHYQKFTFTGQGTSFAIEVDTSRSEMAMGFGYGLLPGLQVDFAFPFRNEAQGLETKAGQGDFLAALTWYRHSKRFPWLRYGLRETVRFPSGFREELAGFESYSTGRTHAETLALLELAGGGLDPERPRFLLDVHGGLVMDVHVENRHALAGASLRYYMLRFLMIETEFAQELRLSSRETQYQFFAGGRLNLPWGFGLKFGMQQRYFEYYDRFGMYAGLNWSHTTSIPVEVRRRHYRPVIQTTLDRKNPVTTELETFSEGEVREKEYEFKPLLVAVLPFVDTGAEPVATKLAHSCERAIVTDSSLVAVDYRAVDQALRELGLHEKKGLTRKEARMLGQHLGVEYVIWGEVLRHEPVSKRSTSIPLVLERSRMQNELDVMVNLLHVGEDRFEYRGSVSSLAEGEAQTHWLNQGLGAREFRLASVERQRLLTENLQQWSKLLMDELFYEYSVQWVVE